MRTKVADAERHTEYELHWRRCVRTSLRTDMRWRVYLECCSWVYTILKNLDSVHRAYYKNTWKPHTSQAHTQNSGRHLAFILLLQFDFVQFWVAKVWAVWKADRQVGEWPSKLTVRYFETAICQPFTPFFNGSLYYIHNGQCVGCDSPAKTATSIFDWPW